MKEYPKSRLFSECKNQLILHGQGVFLFKTSEATTPCSFIVSSSKKTTQLKVEFTPTSVYVINLNTSEVFKDPNNKKGLSSLSGAYYWFSLDSQNQRFYAGIGEARVETIIYRYQFSLLEGTKQSLESLTTIEIPESSGSIVPLRLLRDPVTVSIPLLVKNTNELTMNDIAKGAYIPSSNLSTMGQQLYNCVSGKRFILDDVDFPEFSKAIEYSIATPGKWCNTKLKEKATEFNKDQPNIKETYLRITLGQNNGESPGIPYVMEIWPVGHYSPVHSHASANAIIRVLHGNIHVKLFPFLCDSSIGVSEFGTADFKKEDITWINENLNQVHQLVNLETNTQTCITIQCYMYDQNDMLHYDYFDYLDANGNKQQYEPDSDMDFIDFKNLMKQEWMQLKRFNWC
jgi:hypothetical protein